MVATMPEADVVAVAPGAAWRSTGMRPFVRPESLILGRWSSGMAIPPAHAFTGIGARLCAVLRGS
jgi:hypothetical protein